MNEGDGMAEVTEADREKAWQVLCALPISIPGYSPATVSKARDHLAGALAEEREKARAPFARLADEIEAACRDRVDVVSMTMRDDAALIRVALEDSE